MTGKFAVEVLHRSRRSVQAVRECGDEEGRRNMGRATGGSSAAAAAVWDGMAYDPEAELLYVGTGNGGPWPEELRKSKGKDNLYAARSSR